MTMAVSDRPAPQPRRRRTFTAAQKADFVRRYDQAPHGSKRAFLREHGLYESNIGKWRKAVAGDGRSSRGDEALRKRLADVEAQNEKLSEELAAAQRTVQTLGKAFELLEQVSKGSESKTT